MKTLLKTLTWFILLFVAHYFFMVATGSYFYGVGCLLVSMIAYSSLLSKTGVRYYRNMDSSEGRLSSSAIDSDTYHSNKSWLSPSGSDGMNITYSKSGNVTSFGMVLISCIAIGICIAMNDTNISFHGFYRDISVTFTSIFHFIAYVINNFRK